MRKITIIFLICVFLIPSAFAKRSPPIDVTPVIYNHIKYIAPHWGIFNKRPQNGGYIEAWDLKTGKLLWELKLYTIEYDKNLEQDVQDIFITKIEINGNSLIIWNEAKDKFDVDLNTRKVIPENKIYKR